MLLFPRANAVSPAPFHHSSRSLQKILRQRANFPPFPFNDLQTHFSLFFTLARISPVFATLTQNTLGYTPSPQNLRGRTPQFFKFDLGSGTLFPSLRRTAFPIWLLLARPATQTMDQER